MISSSMPLNEFVAKYEQDNECVLGIFPSVSDGGKRYTIRVVDDNDPKKGLTFVAAFSSKVADAVRPSTDSQRKAASKALFHRIHDKKGRLSMCTCVIDEKSLEEFPKKYSAKDLDTSFLLATNVGSVDGDGIDFRKELETITVDAD